MLDDALSSVSHRGLYQGEGMIRDYGGFPILAGQTNENTDQYRPRATEYFSQFQWLRINVIGLGLNHIRNDQTVTARPICRHGRFKSCNLFGQLGNYLFQFPTLKKGGWAEGQLGWGGVGGGGGPHYPQRVTALHDGCCYNPRLEWDSSSSSFLPQPIHISVCSIFVCPNDGTTAVMTTPSPDKKFETLEA